MVDILVYSPTIPEWEVALDEAWLSQMRYCKLRSMGRVLFMAQAREVWRIYQRRYWEHYYPSFEAWAADPQQDITVSEAYLMKDIIALCVMYFRVHRDLLAEVGYKKWTLLIPQIRKYASAAISAGGQPKTEVWKIARAHVLALLHTATTQSYSDLQAGNFERAGWTVYFHQTARVETLRSMTTSELLDYLGLSDAPPNQPIQITIRGIPIGERGQSIATEES